ncbi:MAG: hypothetical protein ABEI53_02540 [Candidatus Magasanikbacteria bacterium]
MSALPSPKPFNVYFLNNFKADLVNRLKSGLESEIVDFSNLGLSESTSLEEAISEFLEGDIFITSVSEKSRCLHNSGVDASFKIRNKTSKEKPFTFTIKTTRTGSIRVVKAVFTEEEDEKSIKTEFESFEDSQKALKELTKKIKNLLQ